MSENAHSFLWNLLRQLRRVLFRYLDRLGPKLSHFKHTRRTHIYIQKSIQARPPADHTPCKNITATVYRFVSAVDDDASGIFYIRGVDPFQRVEPTGPADVVKPPLKKPVHEPAVIDLLLGCS